MTTSPGMNLHRIPSPVQIGCFGVLAAGAVMLLFRQAHSIRDLEARQRVLKDELVVFEQREAQAAANGPGAATPGPAATQNAVAPPVAPMDPGLFVEDMIAAAAETDQEKMIATMESNTAAIANADAPWLKAVLSRIDDVPGEMQLFYMDMITRKLAVDEPAETIQYLIAGDNVVPYASLRVQQWAARDPEAAIAWLRDPNAEKDRASFLNFIVQGLAERGSADAIAFVSSLPAEDRLSGIRTLVAQPLSLKEQREVTALAVQLPASQRVPIYRDLASGILNHQSFRSASAFVDSLDLTDPDRWTVAKQVVMSNLPDDAEEKGQWLLRISPPEEKARHLEAFVSRWAEADFNAAGEFLNSLDSAAPYHGSAVASFAKKIAGKEPPTAVDWAATISNEKLRAQTLTQIHRTWSAENRESANAYFLSRGIELPAETPNLP